MQNLDMQLFGGAKADLWLKAGHACVNVWPTSGEFPGPHNANGMDWCDGTQVPKTGGEDSRASGAEALTAM
jgi:hypothetical protein